MVLLFHMKQILILVRTFFVQLIYLPGDLKTINCHINWLDYYLRKRSVLLPVSAIICRPYFPCFSQHIPSHFYSIAWVFLGVSVRRIKLAMNRFHTKQTKILGPKNFCFWFFFSSKDKFRGHFNLRRIHHVPKSIIEQTDIKRKHKEQSIRNYYFQVSFVYFK